MRIAQVTDIHLRHHQFGTASKVARRSRLMPQMLREVLREIQKQDVDLLVITGDLLDAPAWLWEDNYGFETDDPAPWRQAALQDYQLVQSMLDEAKLPCMVLPGNHDLEDAFWQVFDRNDNLRDVAGHRVVRFCDRESTCHHPRRFVAQRVRFDQMMLDESGLPQVHLQHYLVHPQHNETYPHTYQESAELTRRIVASGRVRLCLHGHYHPGTELLNVGQTTFATGKAFCVYPHTWRIYDVTDAGVTMQEHALIKEAPPPRPVVYLDRDGVINDKASYRVGPEEMRLIPGSGPAIRRLNEAGFAVVGITSQSAIGMGYVTSSVVDCVHDKMYRLLAEHGAVMDGIYYSSGAGEAAVLPEYASTARAKPHPVLLFEARDTLHLDLSRGWMVGDNLTDIQAGRNAGVKPILVRTGHGRAMSERSAAELGDTPVVDDLAAAVDWILAHK